VRALRITRGGVRRQWSAVTLRARPEPRWQQEFISLLSRQALPARFAAAARRPERARA
jgi:hypothetical protein